MTPPDQASPEAWVNDAAESDAADRPPADRMAAHAAPLVDLRRLPRDRRRRVRALQAQRHPDAGVLTPRIAARLTVPPLPWAGNAAIGRLMVGQTPPLKRSVLCWSLAALLLLALSWRSLQPWPQTLRQVAARWPCLLTVRLLGMRLFDALQYAGLVPSTPVNLTLLGSSMPVWTLAIGALLFDQRVSRRHTPGAGLGLLGRQEFPPVSPVFPAVTLWPRCATR